MSMVKNSLMVFLFVWLSIVVLMPKQDIYYKIEEELAKHDIKLNEEKIKEGFFGLTLNKVKVYVKGINLATIEEVNLCTLLFYNSIELQFLSMDDSLKAMVPKETKKALIQHHIFDPLNISVEADGSFGSLEGDINLSERKIHLDFNGSKNIQMLKPQLKKDENGWYYETSF